LPKKSGTNAVTIWEGGISNFKKSEFENEVLEDCIINSRVGNSWKADNKMGVKKTVENRKKFFSLFVLWTNNILKITNPKERTNA